MLDGQLLKEGFCTDSWSAWLLNLLLLLLVSAETPPESNRWKNKWNRRAVYHCKFEEGAIHRVPIGHTQYIEAADLGTLPHMGSIKLPEAHTTPQETKPGTPKTPRTQQLEICRHLVKGVEIKSNLTHIYDFSSLETELIDRKTPVTGKSSGRVECGFRCIVALRTSTTGSFWKMFHNIFYTNDPRRKITEVQTSTCIWMELSDHWTTYTG
jgi:hypothetical protein